ncbi:hypothetical protein DyAD56_16235 [Dyella sp. AD56]|uniref:hypothetical protein n=1 Tax=Dyella sp. AD56 TaxID=1528744 RepID=UPI000C8669C7|nr:hypothetical protein [Dyella sp. AD56]PMQ04237.1 hypothetical protein DyAD56_16235 [Dyella sp. AD56]
MKATQHKTRGAIITRKAPGAFDQLASEVSRASALKDGGASKAGTRTIEQERTHRELQASIALRRGRIDAADVKGIERILERQGHLPEKIGAKLDELSA